MVMPMIQLDLNEPGAVRLALHGVGGQIPIIEIAGEMDLLGFRGHADKVDRFGHFLGRIAVGGEEGAYLMHRTKCFYWNLHVPGYFAKTCIDKEQEPPR